MDVDAGLASPQPTMMPTWTPLKEPNTSRRPTNTPKDNPTPSTSNMPPPRVSTRGWDISDMCSTYASFKEVPRLSALEGADVLHKALDDYEKGGIPLIIDNWQHHPKWPADVFSMDWLLDTAGDSEIHVRNVHDRKDRQMRLSEFVESSRSQSPFAEPGEPQRLYWKDADCPPAWRDWLLTSGAIPSRVLPCSRDDYLGYLTHSESVESLLCYMGIGDTYTAAHKDLCASSGHNLMCFAEDGGSSYWFMTAADDAPAVAEYFHTKLQQELDWETHFTTIEELGRAPFTVYIAQQKVGDLVMVPPRSCHQVVNHGGLAMKTSWSRMTLDNLTTALRYELPIYRRVCRPEQYRTKTILYRSLLHLTEQLSHSISGSVTTTQPLDRTACARKLKKLVELFDQVLHEEYAACHARLEHVIRPDTTTSASGWQLTTGPPLTGGRDASVLSSSSKLKFVLQPPADYLNRRNSDKTQERSAACNLACDFCGADIFQSFFECKACRQPEDGSAAEVGDGLLVCAACYVEGRMCDCGVMRPAQCRPFDMLLVDRNEAAAAASTVLTDSEKVSKIVKR
ncbi:hypothetical protein C8Q79DRAFT_907570 [Trametes meyenii]|nr:hypothetical protein C8Q79DRAFT_907570 [Trametes meyenii]